MSGYAVAHIRDITMKSDIVAYLEAIDATLKPFGGRFLVHGSEIELLEGAWPGHLVVIEFPDRPAARAWYRSPAYQSIVRLRTDRSRADIVLVDGVGPEHRATDILPRASDAAGPDIDRPLSIPHHLSQVSRYAYEILLLTSVHHAYGAYIYATPWRLHVVALAIAAAGIIGAAAHVFRRHPARIAGATAFLILCLTALVFPFAMIGFFEGGYNHVLKDALYFGGASRELMQGLFPAPAYEMPNSLFFELTGVAQLALGALGARHLYALVRSVAPRDAAGGRRLDVWKERQQDL